MKCTGDKIGDKIKGDERTLGLGLLRAQCVVRPNRELPDKRGDPRCDVTWVWPVVHVHARGAAGGHVHVVEDACVLPPQKSHAEVV